MKLCEHICANEHTWLRCVQCNAGSLCICLTGAKKQLWEARKVPQLCPSPVSHLPASAIKVRQSSTLASLYLWHYTAPSWLARFRPSPITPASCSSRHLSLTCHFFHQLLPYSYLLALASAKAGRKPSERKWWPLCPSSRFSCCGGWHIREVLTDSGIPTKAGFSLGTQEFDERMGQIFDTLEPCSKNL